MTCVLNMFWRTENDEVEKWQATDEPPPAIDPSMTKLVEARLDLPVRAFYKEFLSDEVSCF